MSGNDPSDSHFAQAVATHEEEAVRLGPYASYTWRRDPKHLLFSLARYKFCAKMLAGQPSALEAGCGDAFGVPVLLQSVGRVHGIDIEPSVIEYNNANNMYPDRASFEMFDLVASPRPDRYDAALSLDVIEHIAPELEHAFLGNLAASLRPHAPCIVGTPNVMSDTYASEASRRGHINLKSHEQLRACLARHFHTVFLFSMNDEMVHTGFHKMSHYILAIAVGPRHAAE